MAAGLTDHVWTMDEGSCWIPGSYPRMGVWKAQPVYQEPCSLRSLNTAASEEPRLHHSFVWPQERETRLEGIPLVQIFTIANMVVHIRHELRLDVRKHHLALWYSPGCKIIVL